MAVIEMNNINLFIAKYLLIFYYLYLKVPLFYSSLLKSYDTNTIIVWIGIAK